VSEDQGSTASGRADYRELAVWRNGITLAKHVYQITSKYPSQEIYGLVSQMRRAAVSVPSNIAEGQARHHRGEFARFLQISLGSLAEIDTQLVISYELGFISKEALQTFEGEIYTLRRMLYGLVRSLSAR
jgi:four helix bundle protein